MKTKKQNRCQLLDAEFCLGSAPMGKRWAGRSVSFMKKFIFNNASIV
jgi:hypothetical protein